MTKSNNEISKEIDLTSQYRAIGIPAVKAALLSRTVVRTSCGADSVLDPEAIERLRSLAGFTKLQHIRRR